MCFQVLRACERALLWDEAVYLYKEDGQFDSAVKTMIEHCVCFNHELFLDCVKKVQCPLGDFDWLKMFSFEKRRLRLDWSVSKCNCMLFK